MKNIEHHQEIVVKTSCIRIMVAKKGLGRIHYKGDTNYCFLIVHFPLRGHIILQRILVLTSLVLFKIVLGGWGVKTLSIL